MKNNDEINLEPLTIPMADAVAATTKWRAAAVTLHKSADTSLNFDIIHGFTIPIDELKKVVQITERAGAKKARAYIGIGKNDKNEDEMKLYIVGVDAKGRDILPVGEMEGLAGIYDLTHPCPPTCDVDSPLSEKVL